MADNRKVMDSIRNFLLKMKALDEEIPEELAEDALEMTEEVKDALEEEELVEDGCDVEDEEEEVLGEAEVEDEEGEVLEKKVEDAVTKLLRKHGYIKDSAMESLDELEEELTEDDEDPELTDPEVINAQDSARRLLRKAKPAIASVKDARTRRILSDTLAQALKLNNSKTADYAGLFQMSMNAAKAAKDAAPTNSQDLGSEWAKKFNPHYKEEK